MEKEIPLYKSIYNKIVNRILTGIYPKGYQLASAQKTHAQYGVGYTSIRRAMGLLEEEGFIRQEERRRPVVIFDPEDPRCCQLRWRVFLSHIDAHQDCYRAIPCLLPGLVALGARNCTPQLLDALDTLCAQPEDQFSDYYDLLRLGYTWQTLVIQQTGNALACDLFLQIKGFDQLRFKAMPSAQLVPGEAHATLQALHYWTGLLRRGDLEGLHTMASLFSLQAMCCLDRSFRPLSALPEYREVRQVEFRWYVNQSPTPLYKKISYELLRTACLDGMRAGDCFPSEASLMERFGVSSVTVRGAIALLNSLGLVQTVNGVGTILTGLPAKAEEGAAYLREGRESMEILAACSGALANSAAPRLSPGVATALREELAEYRAHEGIVLWLLQKLVLAIASHALSVVFEQLESRYLFGLYASGLPGSPGRGARLEERFLQTDACLARLGEGDISGFAAGLSALCGEFRDELPAPEAQPKPESK